MGKENKKNRPVENIFFNSKKKGESKALEGFFEMKKVIKAGRKGKNINFVDLDGD